MKALRFAVGEMTFGDLMIRAQADGYSDFASPDVLGLGFRESRDDLSRDLGML